MLCVGNQREGSEERRRKLTTGSTKANHLYLLAFAFQKSPSPSRPRLFSFFNGRAFHSTRLRKKMPRGKPIASWALFHGLERTKDQLVSRKNQIENFASGTRRTIGKWPQTPSSSQLCYELHLPACG